ncbi:LuxR C-terminal-related transcriptional regulator [Candidatus Chloroploca asiatica]|uniref:HTH luxR-type domain-containing protein n=1 Tax=Candidatus Chloroploca asiatica TaxID=1506545 RepID=A0A2H3KMH7_9CHLR|nr:LuxR C-terminal-related transcriptional regulator [Candidatus Chloroploca asiatica]PDV99310.1 hypothetical protein A9Q02_12460 [Candidatus Chloroploca asiatica]
MQQIQSACNRLLPSQPDPTWIERPYLLARLGQALSRRLTLLVAPAGAGKTVLISQWLAQHRDPVAWLTVGVEDNTPAHLGHRLVQAVQQVWPDACAATAGYLAVTSEPEVSALGTHLRADVEAYGERMVLVLDDYHQITSPAIHQLVHQLINDPQARVPCIIASHIEPPWPLTRLRLDQQLLKLHDHDLFWSQDEVRQFFTRILPEPLAPHLITLLHERIEGWAIGYRLIALRLSELVSFEHKATSVADLEAYVRAYLTEEIVDQQPPELQRWLMTTSLFARFCHPLLDWLLDTTTSASHLQHMICQGMVVVPLDHEQGWYRYQPVWTDLLQQRLLTQAGQAHVEGLYRAAAAWFSQANLVEEAIAYAQLAGDPMLAVQIVASHLHRIRSTESAGGNVASVLKQWLALLLRKPVETSVELLFIQASLATVSFDDQRIEPLLAQLASAIEADPRPAAELTAIRGELAALHTFAAFHRGDLEAVHNHAKQAYALLPASIGYIRDWTLAHDLLAYTLEGNRAYTLHQVEATLASRPGHYDRSRRIMLFVAAMANLYSGDLALLRSAAEQLIHAHPSPDHQCMWVAAGHYLLARMHYEQHELEVAEEHFARVLAYPMESNPRIYHDSLIGMALLNQARGDEAAARTYAAQSQAFAIASESPSLIEAAITFEARLSLLQQRPPPQSEARPTAEAPFAQPWLELAPLSRIEVLLAEGSASSLATAHAHIHQFIHALAHLHQPWLKLRLQLIRASVLHALGRTRDALILFQHLLESGQSMGLKRTFLDAGQLGHLLLSEATRYGPLRSYAKHLLEQRVVHNVRSTATPTVEQLLTRREYSVLSMLVQHHSTQEIAMQLQIAPGTVKKHVSNIYGKLHVTNRREALQRARELGLVHA